MAECLYWDFAKKILLLNIFFFSFGLAEIQILSRDDFHNINVVNTQYERIPINAVHIAILQSNSNLYMC